MRKGPKFYLGLRQNPSRNQAQTVSVSKMLETDRGPMKQSLDRYLERARRQDSASGQRRSQQKAGGLPSVASRHGDAGAGETTESRTQSAAKFDYSNMTGSSFSAFALPESRSRQPTCPTARTHTFHIRQPQSESQLETQIKTRGEIATETSGYFRQSDSQNEKSGAAGFEEPIRDERTLKIYAEMLSLRRALLAALSCSTASRPEDWRESFSQQQQCSASSLFRYLFPSQMPLLHGFSSASRDAKCYALISGCQEYRQVLSELCRNLEQEPDSLQLHMGIGITYALMGRLEEARAAFVSLRKRFRQSATVLHNLAVSCALLKDWKHCIKVCDLAGTKDTQWLALPETDAWVPRLKAIANFRLGSLVSAAKEFVAGERCERLKSLVSAVPASARGDVHNSELGEEIMVRVAADSPADVAVCDEKEAEMDLHHMKPVRPESCRTQGRSGRKSNRLLTQLGLASPMGSETRAPISVPVQKHSATKIVKRGKKLVLPRSATNRPASSRAKAPVTNAGISPRLMAHHSRRGRTNGTGGKRDDRAAAGDRGCARGFRLRS